MSHRIAIRAIAVVVLFALTGTAQAFCFLKNKERRMDYSSMPMPAIGFSPAALRDIPAYSPRQPSWYEDQAVPPRQPLYEERYETGRGPSRY